jgi:hypothetical protein
MKRIVNTFCALMLCGLVLLITAGTVMAAEPGYERTSYLTQVVPTIDGMWTSPDEWTDGEVTWIGTDVAFRSTLDSGITRWIVEFYSDTTDDPGDFWRFCIDYGQYGGSSPTGWKFEITGHNNIAWYVGMGTGSDWAVYTVNEGEMDWANSLSASPTNSTPHWILEFQIDKDSGIIQMHDVWNFLLQVNDASNPVFLAWPPTDPNVPDEWGIEYYSTEPIPEGLTFGVMALLSSISVIVGYKYFMKRKETKK